MSETIRKARADGCVCPQCGKDVQAKDIARMIHDELGEIHFYPGCLDCGVYCNSWDNSHWYPNEE